MSEKFGFFDAVVTNGVADRTYGADDLNDIFKGVLSDGIYRLYENALNLAVGSGFSVNVDTGKAIIKDHWYTNTSIKNLVLTNSHGTLNRYSSVVLRYDRTNRTIILAIIDGQPAFTPIIPALTQTAEIYEIRLFNIFVTANATTIQAQYITDVRTYTNGIVDAPVINTRKYDTNAATNKTDFNIPDSYNYTPNTFLQVYVNGLLCAPSEYTVGVNSVQGCYKIAFIATKKIGAQISLVMIN